MAVTLGLKEIASSGTGFQKEVYSSTSSLSGNKLLYTYAKKDETSTPYGNLFRSFNFPLTNDEITIYNSTYQNTALENLNKDEIIVIEIPKGEYGELIDGKTFKLTLPVTLNSVATSTTVYGTYFGYISPGNNNFIGPLLNRQLSERNDNYFGFTPTADNGFNTNVTFLYSNDIQKPNDRGDIVTVLTSTTISVTANSATANKQTISNVLFDTGDEVSITLTPTVAGVDISNIRVEIDGTTLQTNTNNTLIQISKPGINNLSPKIYQDTNSQNPTPINVNIEIKQRVNGTLLWDVWSPTNKFPSVAADESKKMFAIYDTISIIGGVNSASPDKPVGILFQDKGFAVITDPTLVAGFRYSAGTSSGFNTIASGSSYSGGKNFAKIYFTSSTLSNAQFDSITTEFVQNIICVASANEFASTTNTTYAEAYTGDEAASQKPTFITSIGLYNAAQELIGIAKLSEPVKKLPNTIVPFNIRLIV